MDNRDDIFNLHQLPLELREIITKDISLHQLPKVCRSSKNIRQHCKTSNFWIYYLRSSNIADSQQKLHELLVELAKQGDIELFDYIWKTNIVVNNFLLLKENRSLWEGFIIALTYRKKRTANFVQSLNYNWMNKRAARELGIVNMFRPNINYIEQFILKEKLTDLVVYERFDELISIYRSMKRFEDKFYADILSQSPSFEILSKSADIFKYSLSAESSDFNLLCIQTARNNNQTLFDELEDLYGHMIDVFRVHFLESHSINGDKLATRYRSDHNITLEDYDNISYFGNKQILYKFISNYPEFKIKTIIFSFESMLDSDILLLLKDECVDEDGKVLWERLASSKGRDYLIFLVNNIIKAC